MLALLILVRDVVACGAGLLIMTFAIILAAHVNGGGAMTLLRDILACGIVALAVAIGSSLIWGLIKEDRP